MRVAKKPKRLRRAASGSSTGRKRHVTATHARRLAARHVLKGMFKGATVRDGAEVRLRIFNVPTAGAWIVYENLPCLALQSSKVVAVCKRTGRIIYEGSAAGAG